MECFMTSFSCLPERFSSVVVSWPPVFLSRLPSSALMILSASLAFFSSWTFFDFLGLCVSVCLLLLLHARLLPFRAFWCLYFSFDASCGLSPGLSGSPCLVCVSLGPLPRLSCPWPVVLVRSFVLCRARTPCPVFCFFLITRNACS